MSSPLDLVSLQRVKAWLNINALVNTTVATSIAAGQQTVTPANMVGILPNQLLSIDTGESDEEIVLVISTTPTTFTANFAVPHSGPGIAVVLATDAILPDLITSAGLWWLTQTGRVPSDGSVPTVSPLVQVCNFNEWYDGSSTARQFVRNPPIARASGVVITVNGIVIPQSTGPLNPGWVIAEGASSFAIRQGGYSRVPFLHYYRGIGWQGAFTEGIQNVNLQYPGGYAQTPFDIVQACTEMIGGTFKKRQWIGLRSQAMAAGGGTVTYGDWVVEKPVRRVIENYTRKAIV